MNYKFAQQVKGASQMLIKTIGEKSYGNPDFIQIADGFPSPETFSGGKAKKVF